MHVSESSTHILLLACLQADLTWPSNLRFEWNQFHGKEHCDWLCSLFRSTQLPARKWVSLIRSCRRTESHVPESTLHPMRVENLRDTVLDIFPWLPTFLRAPQVRNSEERYHSQSFQKFILAFSSRVTPFCFPYKAFFLRHKLPNIDSIVSMFYVQELCFLICKVGIMIAGSQDKIASSTCKSRLHPRLSLLLCRKETLSWFGPLFYYSCSPLKMVTNWP